jgi:uncharacterized protein YoxC
MNSRPVDLTCPSCHASIRAEQRFCTDCGAETVHGAPTTLVELPLRAAEISVGAPKVPRRRLTRAVALTAAASLIIVALAGATVYLARELSSAHDEITALEGANQELERDLTVTRAELGSTRELSARRKRVLQQAQNVVKQVDPVLSSADTMQVLTAQMQDEQASFADNSDYAISSLATMVSYLASTDAYYYDISYISGVLDNAVAYYEASRADANDLTSLSSKYDTATRGFESKATGYTLAVERLQKQLATATK